MNASQAFRTGGSAPEWLDKFDAVADIAQVTKNPYGQNALYALQ
ncbi:hypothetical protein GA0115259_1091910 [Streptomyces sp. MnatMP-M17]|nr:hypothetical protein GA0115259_1091910 [Streptomyces sp. MnatMP-M17]